MGTYEFETQGRHDILNSTHSSVGGGMRLRLKCSVTVNLHLLAQLGQRAFAVCMYSPNTPSGERELRARRKGEHFSFVARAHTFWEVNNPNYSRRALDTRVRSPMVIIDNNGTASDSMWSAGVPLVGTSGVRCLGPGVCS